MLWHLWPNNLRRFWHQEYTRWVYEWAGRPHRAEEQILEVAGYSTRTGALTGPPTPAVYCLRKCFGEQKPGPALKDVLSNRLRQICTEGDGGRGNRKWPRCWSECERRHVTFRGFQRLGWVGGGGAGGVSGQEGTWEPWPEDGSQLTPS